ncbi:MAG: Ig-like domain repeat protein [Methanosphaera stadtmanae]|nr:Ig-like domain repeat protein [Methanosphaera stadtmanae]
MINRNVRTFFLLSVTLILLVGVAAVTASDVDDNSTVSDISTPTDISTQSDISTSTVVDEVDSDNNYEDVNTEELNDKYTSEDNLKANINPNGEYKVTITGMTMNNGKLVLNSTVTKDNIPISGGRVSYYVGTKWVGSPGPGYGNATLTTNNPGDGTYTVKATYVDVFGVKQANTSATLKINSTDIDISSYSFKNGNLTIKTLVNSHGVSVTSGRVSYSIDGKWVGSPNVSKGIASLTTKNPGKGTHTIKVSYINNNNVIVVTATKSLAINATQVKIDSVKVNSSKLVIKTIVTNLGEDITKGNVVFNLNNAKKGNVTVKNGVATLTMNRPANGAYTIEAVYYNGNSQLAKTSIKYQINKTMIYINSVRDNGTNVTIVGTVIDNGNILSTSSRDQYPQRASLFVDKKWVGSPGIGKNMFVLTRTSPAGGNHTVIAKYINGSNVDVCNDTVTFYTKPQSTKTTISNKDLYKGVKNNITAKITSTYGVNSGRVSFTFNNKWIGSVKVINGIASLVYTIPSTVTSYTLLASFIPDGETYIKSNTTKTGVTILAPTVTTIIGPTVLYGNEKATYNITIKSDNTLVTSGKVNIYVDGKLVSTRTITNGVTSYNYTMKDDYKNHTIEAEYIGTSYSNSESSVLVNYGKYETMTVAEPSDTNLYIGNTVTLTAYVLLAETTSSKVVNGTVNFLVSGKSIGTATLSNKGIATLSYKIPTGTPSLLTINATYTGNNYFTSSSDIIRLNVASK